MTRHGRGFRAIPALSCATNGDLPGNCAFHRRRSGGITLRLRNDVAGEALPVVNHSTTGTPATLLGGRVVFSGAKPGDTMKPWGATASSRIASWKARPFVYDGLAGQSLGDRGLRPSLRLELRARNERTQILVRFQLLPLAHL